VIKVGLIKNGQLLETFDINRILKQDTSRYGKHRLPNKAFTISLL